MKKLYLKKCCFLLALLLLCSFGIRAQIYVDANRPDDSGNGLTPGAAKRTIQAAVNAASASEVILISAGTYDELVVINKPLTIDGLDQAQVNVQYSGIVGVGVTPALFTVAAQNVSIKNLSMNVDLSKLWSAVITSGNASGLNILNSKITALRTSNGNAASYTDRNAIGVNISGRTIPGVTNTSASGLGAITVKGTTIEYTPAAGGLNDAIFRAGVAVDNYTLVVGGATPQEINTITSVNHDVIYRFGNQGSSSVQGNTFKGGGVEIAELNAGVQSFVLDGNTFTSSVGAYSAPTAAQIRIQNNGANIPITVKNNIVGGKYWLASLENVKNVVFDGNTFTGANIDVGVFPGLAGIKPKLVTINTKTIASSTVANIDLGVTFINNTFNVGTATNATAVGFYNHKTPANYGDFIIGKKDNPNIFNNGFENFIYIDNDNNTPTKDGGNVGMAGYPEYSDNIALSTTGYWTANIRADQNKFFIGGQLKTPYEMTDVERSQLGNQIFDKNDVSNIGEVQYYFPVTNVNSGNTYTTIQSAIDAAAPGDEINTLSGVYVENVNVNKQNLKLIGPGATLATIKGVKGVAGGTTVALAQTGVVLEGFTVTRDGNNTTDWNGALNNQGVSMNANNTTARKLIITGNRNGLYINNRQNVLVEYCDIDNNRTGIQTANDISGTIIRNNNITNNWTMGFLYINPSDPVNGMGQTTAADIVKNKITGNWYSQVEFRTNNINVLNFGANFLGQVSGVAASVSTNPSGEPGYAAQIPAAFGGSASAPGTSYMICGIHSDRVDYSADLESYADADPAIGYQPNDSKVLVYERGPLATLSPRLSSAAKIVSAGGTILLKDATINSGGDIPINATLDADDPAIVVNGNLKLNGSNTLLTLAKPATFNGTIEFAGSSIKSTTTNTLTASSSIISGAGYVDGPLKLTGASLTYDMPLGKGGVQTLISFNNPAAAITAEYFNADAGNTSTIAAGSSLTSVSDKEYWNVSSTGTVGTVSLTTFDKNGSGISGTLITEVAFYGGTEWSSYGGTSQTTTGNKFSLTSNLNPITTITGKFTFGTGGPLPVDLVAFEANRANNGALITWETATENQNKEFVIEKSFDGKKFFELKRIDAKGAGKYSYTDVTFLNSAYYRLTQIDVDGKLTTYDKQIKFVKGLNDGVSVTAYPNPTTSKLFVSVASTEKELVKLQLVDITGRILKVQQADTSQPIAFDISDAKPGVYTLRILKNTGDLAKKIVKL